MSDLITLTDRGLWCDAGDLYIDPWAPVERAVITHAHSDHARPGSRAYLCAAPGAELLRLRLGGNGDQHNIEPAPLIQALAFGETITLGRVRLSLHPAGHLLGSAQVRVQHIKTGETWVVSGDYKLQPDPTCEPFEPLRCDCFITECTFGLPVYRWKPAELILDEIREWWAANADAGRASVLYAYALGKAQRLLAGLWDSVQLAAADPNNPGRLPISHDAAHIGTAQPLHPGPIIVHGAIARLLPAYAAAGVQFPEVMRADDPGLTKPDLRRALVIAPPSAANSPWLRRFGSISTGFASGWMQVRGARRRRNVDRGFALSDHADWDGLLATIEATGAARIGVTHGHTHAFARYLREERGLETQIYRTQFSDIGEDEESLAA